MTTFLVKIDSKGGMDFGSSFNLSRFRQFCKENIGKELRIERHERKRSMSQNALYWLYLGIIERETGNLADDLHQYFKRVLLPPKFITVLGQEIKVPKSTTELTKVEFSEYMEKIAAKVDVPIPDTKQYHKYFDSAPLKDN